MKSEILENNSRTISLTNMLQANINNVVWLVNFLNEEQYNKQEKDLSSIGGHIRHIIDFYNSLLNAFDKSSIDYDIRGRNKLVEANKEAALVVLNELLEQSYLLNNSDLKQEILVSESTSKNAKYEVKSTLEREVVFILSHTNHHLGLIKTMCSYRDIALPESFGKAPSTVSYEQNSKQNVYSYNSN